MNNSSISQINWFDFNILWVQYAYSLMTAFVLVCNIALLRLIYVISKQKSQDYALVNSIAIEDTFLGNQNLLNFCQNFVKFRFNDAFLQYFTFVCLGN